MADTSPPLRTPFDEHSNAEEVLADVDLSGRRAIVTGASSGIGAEIARPRSGRGDLVAAEDRRRASPTRCSWVRDVWIGRMDSVVRWAGSACSVRVVPRLGSGRRVTR